MAIQINVCREIRLLLVNASFALIFRSKTVYMGAELKRGLATFHRAVHEEPFCKKIDSSKPRLPPPAYELMVFEEGLVYLCPQEFIFKAHKSPLSLLSYGSIQDSDDT